VINNLSDDLRRLGEAAREDLGRMAREWGRLGRFGARAADSSIFRFGYTAFAILYVALAAAVLILSLLDYERAWRDPMVLALFFFTVLVVAPFCMGGAYFTGAWAAKLRAKRPPTKRIAPSAAPVGTLRE
jgi:uncharacterized membrane protein YedE/YeeE